MTDNPLESLGTLKGHCPSCGPDKNADIKGEHISSFNEDHIWGRTTYRILVCCGCDATYFQAEEFFSEDEVWDYDDEGNAVSSLLPKLYHYPSPIRRKPPKWADNYMGDRLLAELGLSDKGDLWGLFDDIYGCLNANLPIPAAIAIRTTFDKATAYLGIDPKLSFEKKLKALFDLRKISEDERDVLQILVDAGSAAAHRGWKPTTSNLETLTFLIENFLQRTFVNVEAAIILKRDVPARPKRLPKRPVKGD